jgi:hypothetical protein
MGRNLCFRHTIRRCNLESGGEDRFPKELDNLPIIFHLEFKFDLWSSGDSNALTGTHTGSMTSMRNALCKFTLLFLLCTNTWFCKVIITIHCETKEGKNSRSSAARSSLVLVTVIYKGKEKVLWGKLGVRNPKLLINQFKQEIINPFCSFYFFYIPSGISGNNGGINKKALKFFLLNEVYEKYNFEINCFEFFK